MHITQNRLRLFSSQPLSLFGDITVATLLISAVLITMIKLFVGRDGGPPVFLPASMLICALIVATGIRWAPVIGALGCAGYLVGVYLQPFVPYHLQQPKAQFATFVVILLLIMLMITGLGTSIGALVQNYAQRERSTPRWFASALTGIAGIVVGAVLIGAMAQPVPTATTGTTYTNGVPTVHMSVGSFLQSSVTISKGSKLLLVDDGAFPHVLSNGVWQNGQPQPEAAQGAPTVNNLPINGKNVEIGPFPTAGTYHIYCSLHTGMMLTVIVQ